MHGRAAMLGVVVGGVLIAACSSFSSSDAAGGGDAIDAAATPEGASFVDASSPDAPGAEHAFSTGFEGKPFDGDWNGYESQPPSPEVTLLPVEESGNHFVRLTIPAASGVYDRRALWREVPGGSTKLTYSFRARIVKANTKDGWVDVAAVAWGSADFETRTAIALRVDKDEAYGGGFVPPEDYPTSSSRRVPSGEWHAYTIVITPASRENTVVEYLVDGTKFGSMTVSPPSAPSNDVIVLLGATATGSTGETSHFDETVIDFDDITYDAE